jgi:hypothetical protein
LLEGVAPCLHAVDELTVVESKPKPKTVGWMQCYTDVMSTDELLAEALRLTRVDRARVSEELLGSLI